MSVRFTKGLRIRTRCTTIDELVGWFHRFCDETSLFVATPAPRDEGVDIAFSIDLARNEPALVGEGVVLAAWSSRDNRFGQPGMQIGVRKLTKPSVKVFEQLLIARAIAASTAPPAREELQQSWDDNTEVEQPSLQQMAAAGLAKRDVAKAPVPKQTILGIPIIPPVKPAAPARNASPSTSPVPVEAAADKTIPNPTPPPDSRISPLAFMVSVPQKIEPVAPPKETNGGTVPAARGSTPSVVASSSTERRDATPVPTRNASERRDPTPVPTRNASERRDPTPVPTRSASERRDATPVPTRSASERRDATPVPTRSASERRDATPPPTRDANETTPVPTRTSSDRRDPTPSKSASQPILFPLQAPGVVAAPVVAPIAAAVPVTSERRSPALPIEPTTTERPPIETTSERPPHDSFTSERPSQDSFASELPTRDVEPVTVDDKPMSARVLRAGTVLGSGPTPRTPSNGVPVVANAAPIQPESTGVGASDDDDEKDPVTFVDDPGPASSEPAFPIPLATVTDVEDNGEAAASAAAAIESLDDQERSSSSRKHSRTSRVRSYRWLHVVLGVLSAATIIGVAIGVGFELGVRSTESQEAKAPAADVAAEPAPAPVAAPSPAPVAAPEPAPAAAAPVAEAPEADVPPAPVAEPSAEPSADVPPQVVEATPPVEVVAETPPVAKPVAKKPGATKRVSAKPARAVKKAVRKKPAPPCSELDCL